MFDVHSMRNKVMAEIERLSGQMEKLSEQTRAARAVLVALDNALGVTVQPTRRNSGVAAATREFLAQRGVIGTSGAELRDYLQSQGMEMTIYRANSALQSLKRRNEVIHMNGRSYLPQFVPGAVAAE